MTKVFRRSVLLLAAAILLSACTGSSSDAASVGGETVSNEVLDELVASALDIDRVDVDADVRQQADPYREMLGSWIFTTSRRLAVEDFGVDLDAVEIPAEIRANVQEVIEPLEEDSPLRELIETNAKFSNETIFEGIDVDNLNERFIELVMDAEVSRRFGTWDRDQGVVVPPTQ